MLAVMQDGIRSIEKYRHAIDRRSKQRYSREAWWFLSNDKGHLYAFVRICEVLDLDPDTVRRALGLVPGAAHHPEHSNGCDKSRVAVAEHRPAARRISCCTMQ